MNHNEDIKQCLIGISEETYNSLIREVSTARKTRKEEAIKVRFNCIKDDFQKLLEDFPGLEIYNYIGCDDCDCEMRVELDDFLYGAEWCL